MIMANDIIMDIESTGLDACSSQLISIGVIIEGKTYTYFASKPEKEKETIEEFISDMISTGFFDSDNPDVYFITYYGSKFDVPYLFSRGLKLRAKGINHLSKIFQNHIDVYDVVKATMKLNKNSLEAVCRFLGLPKITKISGKDMPNQYLKAVSGDEELKKNIEKHLVDDLKALERLWKLLKPMVVLNG
jgi:uncharacterized protein YprB with RNaseH-like and TPR domain